MWFYTYILLEISKTGKYVISSEARNLIS